MLAAITTFGDGVIVVVVVVVDADDDGDEEDEDEFANETTLVVVADFGIPPLPLPLLLLSRAEVGRTGCLAGGGAAGEGAELEPPLGRSCSNDDSVDITIERDRGDATFGDDEDAPMSCFATGVVGGGVEAIGEGAGDALTAALETGV